MSLFCNFICNRCAINEQVVVSEYEFEARSVPIDLSRQHVSIYQMNAQFML